MDQLSVNEKIEPANQKVLERDDTKNQSNDFLEGFFQRPTIHVIPPNIERDEPLRKVARVFTT
jgi:hypothetical protein